MEHFSAAELRDSRNEWCSRLVSIMEKTLLSGLIAIFKEAVNVCDRHGEPSKYLKTFQNFLSEIPKWSAAIVEREQERICTMFDCDYLGDLITCVHLTQLKLLSASRVSSTTKTVTIETPDTNKFIHACYICAARQMWKNIYLFEKDVPPLKLQENARGRELIVRECIMTTIRDTIPIRTLLKSYLDQTVEKDVEENVREEIVMTALDADDRRVHASAIQSLNNGAPIPPVGAPSDAAVPMNTQANTNVHLLPPTIPPPRPVMMVSTPAPAPATVPAPAHVSAPVPAPALNNSSTSIDSLSDSNTEDVHINLGLDDDNTNSNNDIMNVEIL